MLPNPDTDQEFVTNLVNAWWPKLSREQWQTAEDRCRADEVTLTDMPGIMAAVHAEPFTFDPVHLPPADTRKPALPALGVVADIDHRCGTWK